MKFKTVQEAFNFYRGKTIQEIETRAAAIKGLIDTDANADVGSLNIELDGLKEARTNIEERANLQAKANAWTPIAGGGFTQPEPEADDVFASKEYRSAFFKTLLGQELNTAEDKAFKRATTEKRADAFSTVTSAAAVLPTTTLNEVIKKARTIGGLLPACRAFNIPTKISVPVGTPATKAAWHVEGVVVESEKNDPAAVVFDGYEIIKVFSISAAAKKMSIDAFEAYIVDELNSCVMECLADAVVNGTGTAQGKGLETITWTPSTNAIEYTKGAIPAYTDFTKTMALLKRGYAAGAKWAMNNATLYNCVYSIVDSNKRPIFIADPKNESIGYILGHEVIIDDNIANGDIYLGNFQYMGYNIPEGILIEVSRESSFKSGLIDYRAIAVADTKPIVAEAFVKLSEATV